MEEFHPRRASRGHHCTLENNELDASKLQGEFSEVLPIKESLIKYVFEPNMQATVE